MKSHYGAARRGRAFMLAGAGLLAVAVSSPSYAQDETAADAPTSTNDGSCVDPNNAGVCATSANADTEGPAAFDNNAIVVTGSRIPNRTFDSPSPVTVLTRDDATVAGFDSTTELLQSTAVTAGARQIDNSFTGFIVDGGPGANTLSLRSLGAARTLILLNGRRLSPSGTNNGLASADLNVLPSAIVQRVEVLKDGASSIYGSDAVAGVVNIITDQKFEGLTLDGGVSVPEVGEGVTRRLAVIGGYNGDRFRISGSFEAYARSNLSFAAHDYLQCQTYYLRSAPDQPWGSGDPVDPRTGEPKCYPTGFTGTSGVTVNTIGTSVIAGAAGGPGNPALGTFNRFRYNPAAGGSVPGWEGVNGGGFGLDNRDTYNSKFFDKSLISPTTNYNAYVQTSYDLHALGDAQLYGSVLYTRRESAQRNFFQMILDYPNGSPLIPAELQFSDQAPTDQTNGQDLGVRVFTSRNYTSTQNVDYFRVGGGLRGSLPFKDWRYDIYAGTSYNFGEYFLVQPITSRLIQSMDVVASGSGFACSDPSNGCVAAPALTGALVNGDVPQDFLNFIAPTVRGTTKFWETTFSGQVTGSLFTLPGGDVGVALGAEYRKQRIEDVPPIEQQTGQLYNYSTAGITEGKDAVKEVFGEINVPLLANQPFFHELTLNGSVRYTDYDSYGSDWTYKIGGVWSPIRALAFRGTYGTSYRAPALSEQFQAATAGFLSSNTDPCYQYGDKDPSTSLYKNCLAAGIPTTFGDGQAGSPLGQSVQVLNVGGAATGLAAETSKNWTVGAVIRNPLPKALGNFEFAVDYFDIQVDNGVATLGASNILNSCYNDPNFDQGNLGGELCRLISRDGASSTTPYRATVTNGNVNIATDKVRGLDFNARYVLPIGNGSLRLNASATRYLEQADRTFPTDPLVDNNGDIYYPKWTGNFDATYRIGKVSFYYGLNWVGVMDSYEANDEDPATSDYQFRTPNYFTHTASVRLNLDNFAITAGVKNFTDSTPPSISAFVYNRLGNAPLYSGFDFVGRTYYMNFTAKIF
ncbi:TonB-dependent receptor [Porphyrobacter algicida]|uniref:TonB-dependent receptor n=1 Tax=Qipengyuania algicida TaxID=1836209 RepID=A0A845ADU8_9SPHN|nr:TonB-dependent receptor [Qipengyuania algicida]MXP27569.1 TonB-dependent receptor [Qipengyuania algicida]